MTRALSIPMSVTSLDQISELFGTKEDAHGNGQPAFAALLRAGGSGA